MRQISRDRIYGEPVRFIATQMSAQGLPVYEYRCGDCDKKFELFTPQRMSTEGVVCRTCHSGNVRKLVSTFARVGGGDSEMSAGDAEPMSTGGGCCGGSCGCGCAH